MIIWKTYVVFGIATLFIPNVVHAAIGAVCTANGDCDADNNEVCDTGNTDKCICATGHTDNSGTCNPNDCGTVPTVTGATRTDGGDNLFGTTATFTCDAGYDTAGTATIACQADGTWETPQLTCTLKDCGTVPTVTGATRTDGGNDLFGTTATFTCDAGYDSAGTATIACQADGTWETPQLTCTPNVLGDTCSDNNDCSTIANSKCDTTATPNVCACADDHKVSSSSCIARVLGDTCSDNNDCSTIANSKCDTTATPNVCACSDDHKVSSSSCIARVLGDTCSDNNDCSTIANSKCDTTATPNVCACADDHKVSSGSCIARVVGDSCSNDAHCPYTNGVCTNDICACDTGYSAEIEGNGGCSGVAAVAGNMIFVIICSLLTQMKSLI